MKGPQFERDCKTVQNRRDRKPTIKHIIIKFKNIKDKGITLFFPREKQRSSAKLQESDGHQTTQQKDRIIFLKW